MTLFLIVLIVFLCVWFSDSAKKKEIQEEKKKWENVNIPLQDKLEKEYFVKIINDLRDIDKRLREQGYDLIEELEKLYNRYGIPFQRGFETPEAFRTYLQNDFHNGTYMITYGDPFFTRELMEHFHLSPTPIEEEIFGFSAKPPAFITHPNLLFGTPNSKSWYDADGKKVISTDLLYHDGKKTQYEYDSSGRLTTPWAYSRITIAIRMLITNLVRRDLYNQGYAYSDSRNSTQKIKENEQYLKKVKNDNPWLFSPPEKDQKNTKK